MKRYLVSACLLGLCTRYDGKSKASPKLAPLLEDALWIPVCPEQLGGMATPRPPADLSGGNGHQVLQGGAKVITNTGVDVSHAFCHGAQQTLLIAKLQNIDAAILKARSPSCGVHEKRGVTAALLLEHGYPVIEI